ncbi:MAG TPA: ATP-binding protein [Puia sp.]|nr:ATP-binding protein [Puia sp.]
MAGAAGVELDFQNFVRLSPQICILKLSPMPLNPRKYMQMAIDAMKKSVSEVRHDQKPCPKVGAVLVSPDEKHVQTAFRGELREGDHAEYTLLERKNRDRNLKGYYLFATLEPCAPGARRSPKLACAERVVNTRIAKVWVGIEDPDPTVDRKGIQYLIEKGIEVEMFDEEFQADIIKENKEFLASALKRAEEVVIPKEITLSPLEKVDSNSQMESLFPEALRRYIIRSGRNIETNSPELYKLLEQQELIVYDSHSRSYKPSGHAILLFGSNPELVYPQAIVKAEIRHANKNPSIRDFTGPLVLLPDTIEEWLRQNIPGTISRERFARTENYDYPLPILREAIINAIVHRDYDNYKAKIYLIIEDDKIIVRSPGDPVKPIKWEDFSSFKAPSLSRNPRIMSIFNQMGYVEERGIGMREMKSVPTRYHLPLPIITRNKPYIDITFPRGNAIKVAIGQNDSGELNEEEESGLLFLHNTKEFISKRTYAEHFNFDEKKAQRHLGKFKKLGLVTTQGSARALRYKATI